MSFLAPLYVAGLLAVALPLAFHLIRRTPQGETAFSSLMFLSPSPPRITRRSRLEHLVLLALRGLALILLAAAFSRPFWRQSAAANQTDAPRQRVAILVDTSASMRRDGLWAQAVRAVRQAVAERRPLDDVGVFAFDETLRPIAGFEELARIEPRRRASLVEAHMKAVEPTSAATHLGQALLDATALLEEGRDDTAEAGRAGRRIVLVSDMQAGSRPNVVGDYPWPVNLQLELKPVAPATPGNAGLARLADADDGATSRQGRQLRIRLANAADSGVEQFRLEWADATGDPHGGPVEAYVPPGESRVVRVSPPPRELDVPRLVLDGDAHAFDNVLFVVPRRLEEATVVYIGADAADDPQGLRYYLDRALESTASGNVRFRTAGAGGEFQWREGPRPDLVVVAGDPAAGQARQLGEFAAAGGAVLCVVTRPGAGRGVASLLNVEPFEIEEAKVDGYAMLGEIDFGHPMFEAMAGPKFNDFTQIRFWKHRRLKLEPSADVRVVARFESGDPAIVERRVGKGRVVVMAAGWQPSDGQLARSWKFLLMLSALVDGDGAAGLAAEYQVNERVALPPRNRWADAAAVTKPDGSRILLADDASAFADTAEPGVYSLDMVDGKARFAVNLDPAESLTAPLAAETFEQLGCRMAGRADPRQAERLDQLRDVELERRQKIWQWLIAAALAVLIVETWLAGRMARTALSHEALA